ncbi:MAG: ThuA domain-containing protein [Sedimentisphaeraceae bacterium JB056]
MKKALFVWGGWDGHEPKQCIEKVSSELAKRGFETVISDTLESYLDAELMASVDLIVQCVTMSEITSEQSKALRDAVKGGVGFGGWHGGMCDSFRNDTEYQFMTGGQWVVHPGGDKAAYTVNILDKNDPIIDGVKDFEITSEQYYMHVDPGVEVLATTTFSGQYEGIDWIKDVVMPMIWKKMYGKGKVFYSGLGHVAKDFDVPEVMETILRGLEWAAK